MAVRKLNRNAGARHEIIGAFSITSLLQKSLVGGFGKTGGVTIPVK